MKLLDQEMLRSFRKECSGALGVGREAAEEMVPEQLLTLFYAYYHYFGADPDCSAQLLDGGLLYDADATHCITGIFRAPEADDVAEGTLDVLVALGGDSQMTPMAVGAQLASVHRSCEAFLEGLRGTFSGMMGKVETRLRNLGYEGYGNDRHPLRFRFLLPFVPTDKNRDTIERKLPETLSLDDNVLFGDEIEYEVRNTNSACGEVRRDMLRLDKPGNVCRYGNALVVNVTAASLRRLYQTYRYRGLLSQNLRYFVKMPRVDDAMVATITEAPEDFWYLNNGIIISCKSYTLDGDRLELESFSIINGGQTTHNIGELPEELIRGALMVPCKVIPMKPGMKADARLDFIAEISEASNTQKPIKAIDAVANRREQRKLKQWLVKDKACPIFYQAKRGETFDRRAFQEPWQKLESGTFAQCLLAFFYQYPGTARNQKARLFSDDALYRQLFFEPFPEPEAVRDLNVLYITAYAFTKSFRQPVPRADTVGTIRRGLATNGLFQLMACVGVLCKLLHETARANASGAPGPVLDAARIGLASPAYPFLNRGGAPHYAKLTELLDYCLETFIRPGYEDYLSTQNGGNAFSNFTKLDGYYRNYVLPKILQKAASGFSSEEDALLRAALRHPEAEELSRIAAFESRHPLCWGPGHASGKDALVQQLFDHVEAFPKATGIKKPTRTNLKKIVNRGLRSRRAFISAGFTSKQCDHYGPGILEILKQADLREAESDEV